MRFLILGLNYLPESTSIGPYTAELAEHLQQRGHEVQVVAGFPMAPQWEVWAPYRGRRIMREVINGVPVLRTYLYVPRRPKKALNRVLFDMSFSISSLLGGLVTGKCDMIVVVSPPLQLGIGGVLLGRLKGSRVFFHIQDLMPDAAIATGMLAANSVPARIARALERYIYRHVDGIGVISDGFARHVVAGGAPPEKVKVLPNYVDVEFMRPAAHANAFRHRQGIAPDCFLVMYSGSVALKQGLHTLVEAAGEFR
ncbi:MAG: glycosyltransferase, partial [Armatimonadota bacterium]